MASKNGQRTKGNVKPSSSSRAAEFLQQEGKIGFVGFTGVSGNYGYVSTQGEDSQLDGEMKMLSKKMTKKDTVTKLKAIQEFKSLCQEKESGDIKVILQFWPRIFNKLSTDFDHRVREATQEAHFQVATKGGKALAPTLKSMIANWLLAQHDPHAPAAQTAMASFQQVFPTNKQKEVFAFCQAEILKALENNILTETMDTLSDPKVVPLEERESRYARVVSCSFLVLNYCVNVNPTTTTDLVKMLLAEKKFWKFAKHKSSLIRGSLFELLATCCNQQTSLLEGCLPSLGVAVLTSLDEQHVIQQLWNVVLVCVTKFRDVWSHVNSRKAVLPKLWSLLRNFCYGNSNVVLPNLLPFLSQIPSSVIGDQHYFYKEFFDAFFEGVQLKKDKITDFEQVISSYMECFRFMLVSNLNNQAVTQYLLHEQFQQLLDDVFVRDRPEFIYNAPMFFEQFKQLSTFIQEKHTSLYTQFWDVLFSTVFADSKLSAFKAKSCHLYEMVTHFIEIMCAEPRYIQPTYQKFVYASCNSLLKDSEQSCSYFIKIVSHELNIPLLKNILNLQTKIHNSENDFSICVNSYEKVLHPMLSSLKATTSHAKLVVQMLTVLSTTEHTSYLKAVFSKEHTDEYVVYLLIELFETQDEAIARWLEEEMYERISKISAHSLDSWNMFSSFIQVIKDCKKREKLTETCLKQMSSSANKNNQDVCFETISKLYSKGWDESYFSTWIAFSVEKEDDFEVLKIGIKDFSNSQEFCNMFIDYLQNNYTTQWKRSVLALSLVREVNCELFKNIVQSLVNEETVPVNKDSLFLYGELIQMLTDDVEFSLHLIDQENLFSIFLDCLQVYDTTNDAKTFEEAVVKLLNTTDTILQAILKKLVLSFKSSANHLSAVLSVVSNNCQQNLANIVQQCFSLVESPLENAESLCVLYGFARDELTVSMQAKMHVDLLTSSGQEKGLPDLLKVTSHALSAWHSVINESKSELSGEYISVAFQLIQFILQWSQEQDDTLALATCLTQEQNVELDLNLMHLMQVLVETAASQLQQEHWDFYLCTFVSWLQTCEETLNVKNLNQHKHFFSSSFQLFAKIAAIFNNFTLDCSRPLLLCEAQPVDVSEQLMTEWKDFFLPASSAAVLNVFLKITQFAAPSDGSVCPLDEDLTRAVCAGAQFVSREHLLNEHIYKGLNSDKQKKQALQKFFETLNNNIMHSSSMYIKFSSYQLLSKLKDLCEIELCEDVTSKQLDVEPMRQVPQQLENNMTISYDATLSLLSTDTVSITQPLCALPQPSHRATLLTYLLSWQLILGMFRAASPGRRAMLVGMLHRQSNRVAELLTCVCCVLNNPKQPDVLRDFSLREIEKIAFSLYTNVMSCMPAIARNWFNKLNRKEAAYVEKFTSTHVSPTLLKNEFARLSTENEEQTNMTVKTLPGARQIIAKYSLEEMTMELALTLPPNYPLQAVSVESGKRFGVSTAEWRKWMLQLTTFLSFQNGAVWDGLTMWRKNVDKRFAGVEECMVCFSVIHQTNYSLPSIACKTCKKKFHPVCLYKWFGTSGKSTCPLCRDQF